MINQMLMPWMAFFFLILPSLPFATAQGPVTNGRVEYSCIGNGNYTGNSSTYRINLNAVLATLAAKVDSSGYYSASVGQTTDRVNAAVLCRGDVDLHKCRECTRAAINSLLRSCPNQKQAITWYRLCMLRFSDEPIFGILATTPGACLWNPFAAVNDPQFWRVLKRLVDEIQEEAVAGHHNRKVAVGNITGPDFQRVFALAQCTPDLSRKDCKSCLGDAAGDITGCCNSRRGCRIHRPSCNLRYEIFHFFNETRLEELAQSVPVSTDGNKGRNVERIIIIVGGSIIAGVILAVLVSILLRMRRKKNPTGKSKGEDDISTAEPLEYGFGTIRAATSDFSDDNKLGQGGYGVVYKGTLPNGLEIAVKRLSKDSVQRSSEFKNEVRLLARLLHRNLVKLLGFCEQGMEKLLVYEFVSNGSLDHFIFDPSNRWNLDWDRRFKIIRGIARGLLYLHEDSQLKIIHRDLKASNVLLDKDMVPKIADFSLARMFEQDETHKNTRRIAGTHGYMSPEYAMHGRFSAKSDVFSFGVLVLEIISGRRNSYAPQSEEATLDLLSFAWKNWCDGTSINTVDNFLRPGLDSMSDILRCIHIGLLCVQQNPVDRPTMASVGLMLGSLTITMAIPSKPAFCVPNDSGPNVSSLQHNNSPMVYIPAQYDEHVSENDGVRVNE